MKRVLRAASIFLAVAILIPVLAACGGSGDDDDDSEDPTPTAEAGAEQELTDVSIGYVPVLIYAPVMIAHDKGYFEELGIASKLNPLTGGADMVTLTANGDFDIGIGGAGPAFFNAINRGVELTVIAPLHFEHDPQATPLMVSKERFDSGEITSVADLEGKKVAVNARGATEYWLDQALRTGGLTIEDIELQELGFADVPAALASGALDASMLGEPLATRAEQEGIAVRLVDGFISEFQPTFVYVNSSFADENREVVVNFLAGYLQGCRDLTGDDWASEENMAFLEEQTGVSPELIQSAARTYCEPNGEINVEDLETLQQFFADRDLLDYDEMMDVESFIDRSYVEEAVEQIGTYEEE